ncbi:hypothetical protein HY620_01120 [Candidatus Uhrbacteria bacterium]|nr:hypothetical protein [Candidatus Uhrbacteria bacterium]
MPVVDHTKQFQLLEKITPLLIVCIFGVVWGVSYYLYIQHELQRYLSGGTLHQETVKRQLADRSSYLERLKHFAALYNEQGTDPKNAFASIAPLKKDIPSLFQLYEQIAYKHNLGLQLVDIIGQDGSRKDAPGIKEVIIALKLTNVDYEKMKSLLADIETNARLTDVQSFDFDPESRSLSLNVKMYYFAK